MISKDFIKNVENKGYSYKEYNVKNIINKKEDVLVSVLIPTYNAEKYIKRCLDSIINQTLDKSKYEIIVVNDGSTDNTCEILKNYPNINIINQKNMGISVTRNICLNNANGKYIAFIDSDDYISQDYLEILLQEIECNNMDFVKCAYNIEKNNLPVCQKKIKEVVRYNGIILEDMWIDGYLWASIFKKSLFENITFPEGYWFEDMITKSLIFSRIKKYKTINKSLYYYVIHDDSATKIQGKKKSLQNLDQLFLVEKIIEYKNELNEKMSNYFKVVILKELLEMLPFRIKNINNILKKNVFFEACNIINSIDFSDIESSCYRQLNIFKKEKYYTWRVYYIILKIKKKLGVFNE